MHLESCKEKQMQEMLAWEGTGPGPTRCPTVQEGLCTYISHNSYKDLLLFHFYRSGGGFWVFNIQSAHILQRSSFLKKEPNTTAIKLSSSES